MTRKTLRIHDPSRTAIKPDGTKIPVIDSKFTFLITPDENDIKNGVPGDHARCMYCLACRRMHKSELVWVARGVAYVELRNKQGKPELHRFILSDPAKVKIKDFDASKHVPVHSVVFTAPSASQSLEHSAREYRIRKAKGDFNKEKRKAHVVGQKQKDHSIHPLELALRDPATGMFQFKSR
jgi:hypothetical protein